MWNNRQEKTVLRLGLIGWCCLMLIPGGILCADVDTSSDTEHHEGEPDIFSGNLGTAIFTVAVFLVLLVVLGKWAWGPILSGLQDREEKIRLALEKADRSREEAERTLAEYRQQLEQARQQAQTIIEEGRSDAVKIAEQLRGQAEQEAQTLREKAQRDIAAAKDQALKEIYEQTTQLATDMAAGIIGKSLNPEDHHRLLQESLNQLQQTDLET